MRKINQLLHHNQTDAAATNTAGTTQHQGLLGKLLHHGQGTASSSMTGRAPLDSSMGSPYGQYSSMLPPQVLSWQQGQPIPEGWRLGRQGYLKPVFVLPSHLSSWQQGQPIPEGYRLSKRGTLRPVNYFQWWSTTYASAAPTTVSTNLLPAQVELREKPAVVQEVIRPGVREEIQPVIHREREQMEIREEIQPIYEKSVRPTIVEQRQLAPEMRPEVRLGQYVKSTQLFLFVCSEIM
jgi:hypothetical protein